MDEAPIDPRVVAIDGPAGAGKSTVGRALAARLGLEYLDTGAMYRAVTVAALARGVDVHDEAAVAALAARVELTLGAGRVHVDGDDVTEAIRTAPVNVAVSAVAANPSVRAELSRRMRAWADARGGGVIEGRDIGTVVFPGAVAKLYLTASPAERAARRHREQPGGEELAAVAASIARRDEADRTREHAPLAEAADAVVVDTTGRTIDEVVDALVALVAQRRRARGAMA
jgi:cytidylate kinase